MIIFSQLSKKVGLLKIIILELVAAFLLGIFLSFVLEPVFSTNSDYTKALLFMDVAKMDKFQLFLYVLQYRLKSYLLIWIFSVTILCVPFNIGFVLYRGALSGFVIGMIALMFGAKGFFYGVSLSMPQGILYIIVMVRSVMISYRLHERMESMVYGNRTKMYLKQFPAFLTLLACTIIGCFLEAYLNPSFLVWVRSVLNLGSF